MNLNFSKLNGLLPCIIQDSKTQKVLMLGFMDEQAFEKTVSEKKVTFFSRSKNELWTKGETSGNYLYVDEILSDCDNDTILIKVKPTGPVCHTGSDTCFGEENNAWSLKSLESIVQHRKVNPTTSSYTSKLFDAGINKIAQKVGEEAVELVIESKDANPDLFLNEAADLMFHFLVLLAAKNHTLKDVEDKLLQRHK